MFDTSFSVMIIRKTNCVYLKYKVSSKKPKYWYFCVDNCILHCLICRVFFIWNSYFNWEHQYKSCLLFEQTKLTKRKYSQRPFQRNAIEEGESSYDEVWFGFVSFWVFFFYFAFFLKYFCFTFSSVLMYFFALFV